MCRESSIGSLMLLYGFSYHFPIPFAFLNQYFFYKNSPKDLYIIMEILVTMSKTLQIKRDTHQRLLTHKQSMDNFDTLLTRLLDKWEGFYALSR